jgi:hypothetical protein
MNYKKRQAILLKKLWDQMVVGEAFTATIASEYLGSSNGLAQTIILYCLKHNMLPGVKVIVDKVNNHNSKVYIKTNEVSNYEF